MGIVDPSAVLSHDDRTDQQPGARVGGWQLSCPDCEFEQAGGESTDKIDGFGGALACQDDRLHQQRDTTRRAIDGMRLCQVEAAQSRVLEAAGLIAPSLQVRETPSHVRLDEVAI